MTRRMELLELRLDAVAVGVDVTRVVEVAARVHHTPLATGPTHILGLVTYRGAAIAVVDLRQRLGLPPKQASSDDQLVIVRTVRGRTVALLVDRVLGFRSGVVVAPPVPAEHVAGVVVFDDGLLLLDDVDAVLSLDDERIVDAAIAEAAP